MNHKFPFASDPAERIVYVRPVEVAELPDELREQVGDIDTIYAVHADNGERLALVRDRAMAFYLAREHDMSPVGVH